MGIPLPDNDGSVAADLRGESCGDVASSVQQWIDGHRGCVIDADCTIVKTACGLRCSERGLLVRGRLHGSSKMVAAS